MGGSGSGRWFYSGKRPVAEDCLFLDISKMKKWRFLDIQPGRIKYASLKWTSRNYEASMGCEIENIGELMFTFNWSHGKEKIPKEQRIYTLKTFPNYGGERIWFCCPQCDRIARKLYMPPRFDRFYCRRCLNLTYQSSNENKPPMGLLSTIANDLGTTPDMVRRVLRNPQKYNKSF
ncbi:hypothetical protein ACFLQJ_02710 [Calditrichota bacterium]